MLNFDTFWGDFLGGFQYFTYVAGGFTIFKVNFQEQMFKEALYFRSLFDS